MSRRDDERLLEELRRAMASDDREPPADRVTGVRAMAEQRREQGAPAPAPPRRPAFARRQLLAGGAAASVGAVIGAAGYALQDDDVDVPTEPVPVAALRPGVEAEAELINHTWGVEYLLQVAGLPPERTYDVVYRAVDGGDVAAGSFVGVAVPMTCRMTAALLRERTAAIEVLDDAGTVVLRSVLA